MNRTVTLKLGKTWEKVPVGRWTVKAAAKDAGLRKVAAHGKVPFPPPEKGDPVIVPPFGHETEARDVVLERPAGANFGVIPLNTDKPWYGRHGVCDVCGDNPRQQPVIYYDPDDGWQLGVLCVHCAQEQLDILPDPENDYCWVNEDQSERLMRLLAGLSVADPDAIAVEG